MVRDASNAGSQINCRRGSRRPSTCSWMLCLERLRSDTQRLLRGENRCLQGRGCRTTFTHAACSNVLTPDRIPEFCIPPRLAPCPTLAALRNSWVKKAGTDDSTGHTDWDPRSQAALSLPHLPRTRTAYGFCALLGSPHTRRKESLFLGDPGAAALLQTPAAGPVLHPRVHTYRGNARGDTTLQASGRAPATTLATPACPCQPQNTLAPRPRGHRLLRASEGLFSRALRAPRSRDLTRACSVPSGDKDKERGTRSGSTARTLSVSPPKSPNPAPERLEVEGTVALGRAGDALRLAAEYNPNTGHLRLRLLPSEVPAEVATEAEAIGCCVRLVLQPPSQTRQQRSTLRRRSRKAISDQDFCLDGLSGDEVRRLAVRVKAENKSHGLERSCLLGQGELLLGSFLLP